jgi:hypothetical protein
MIRRYLEQCEANQPNIHYSQWRPTDIHPPSGNWSTDCSGLVINAFHWADMWLPYLVKDPGGYGYTGIGNTTTILSTNRKRVVPLDHKFFVGDMALFGPRLSYTKHVIICRRNGNISTSIWTSHGSERGPYAARLRYRPDLLCVVRAESLA